MKLSLLPTTTILLALIESTASSSDLHRIRSSSADDVAATTSTHASPHSTRRRSLFIMDDMPNVGLEDVDMLLFGGSSMSMSFSHPYEAYNNENIIDNSVVGNDDVNSIGGTSINYRYY
jgi:hypothetical protein